MIRVALSIGGSGDAELLTEDTSTIQA
jgi:hypothetical protein